jgi:hypothetical protein
VRIIQNNEKSDENSAVIKLHRQRSGRSQRSGFSTNDTKISAIEELDRCIAEFESEDGDSVANKRLISAYSSQSTSASNTVNVDQRDVFSAADSVKTSISSRLTLHRFTHGEYENEEDVGYFAAVDEVKVYSRVRPYKSEVQIYSKDGLVTPLPVSDSNNNIIEDSKVNYNNVVVTSLPPPAPPLPALSGSFAPPPPPPPPMPANWSTMDADPRVRKNIVQIPKNE